MSDTPRRNRIDLYTPAEKAISEAVQAVESAGAHPRLTDAVIHLRDAMEAVADFVDKVPPKPVLTETEIRMKVYEILNQFFRDKDFGTGAAITEIMKVFQK